MKIDPETEFWAHCSNLQAWHENEYDTRLLHSNLAFPLLKKLTEVGDPLARKMFKEEIALRLESGHPSVVIFLIAEKYIDFLDRKDFLLSILDEKDALNILKIEKSLKIKLSAEYEYLGFCTTNAFIFDHKNVTGLQLFDLNVNPAFKYIVELEHLYFLSLNGCKITGLPRSIENLKNLTILDLSDNKLEFIPKKIGKLLNLQEVYLGWNHILKIQNVVEIVENLDRLTILDITNNEIKTLPDNLAQIKLDCLKI